MRSYRVLMLCVMFLAIQLVSTEAQTNGEWRYYSGDNRATKYSPLDQINKDNVAKLKVAWRHPQADPAILAAAPSSGFRTGTWRRRSWSAACFTSRTDLGLAEAIDPATRQNVVDAKAAGAGPEGLPRARSRKASRTGVGSEARILTFASNTSSRWIRRPASPIKISATAARSI